MTKSAYVTEEFVQGVITQWTRQNQLFLCEVLSRAEISEVVICIGNPLFFMESKALYRLCWGKIVLQEGRAEYVAPPSPLLMPENEAEREAFEGAMTVLEWMMRMQMPWRERNNMPALMMENHRKSAFGDVWADGSFSKGVAVSIGSKPLEYTSVSLIARYIAERIVEAVSNLHQAAEKG